MKKSLTCALIGTAFALPALGQDIVASCEQAIKYDVSEIQNNFASKLAVWESIDRMTFEQRKEKGEGGVTVYGIPITFSYEQFDEERTRLRQSFNLQQNITFSSNSRWQAVDPGSTARYIECIDQLAKKKFTASVIFATREVVSIRVKKVENPGQINRDKVKVVLVTGGDASREEATLTGNAATSLTFKRTPGAAFTASLVLFTEAGDDLDSADFALPRFTNIRNEQIQIPKESNHVTCIQTFPGPAPAPLKIVADLNEVLVIGTHEPKYTFVNGAGPGGVGHSLISSTTRSMEMQAYCASSNNNTSASFDIWFIAKALRDNFVDVDLQKTASEALQVFRKK